MGLKEFFFGKKDNDPRPRKIVKAEKKITDMFIQAGDRQYFLDQLRLDGSDEAIRVMLKRFRYAGSNTTIDRDEKEMTAHFLVSLGDAAIGPIKDYLKTQNDNVNWPFRALKDLLSPEDLLEFLIDILASIEPDYVRQPERKEQMILTAKDFPDERISKVVAPFLQDPNETIRFLAVDVLITHQHDFSIEALLAVLPEEESQRTITRVVEGFIENDWSVPDPSIVTPYLPNTFVISSQGKIVRV